ncbi:MAG: hypothetical protein ACLP6G_14435 [Terriglobales bacterium]
MTASRSDALVLFGVTGDLAHKMVRLFSFGRCSGRLARSARHCRVMV